MSSRRTMAVDLGGTFLKVGVFEDGALIWMQRTRVDSFQESSMDGVHLSPCLLSHALHDAVRTVSEVTGDISSVMVTGQMAGIAICERDGSALRPLLTWQTSSARNLEDVRNQLSLDFEKITGERLAPHLPLLKLPELDVSDDEMVTSLIGYVGNVLADTCGSIVHITDAASWGMCDVRDGAWVPDLLRLANISEGQLPRISWNIEPIGHCNALSAPVYCAVGDQQAALLGAALQASEVSVNLATGCQVSVRSVNDETPFQIRPFFAGEFLQTRTHLPAGRLLESAVNTDYGAVTPVEWDRARSDVVSGNATERVRAAVGAIADAIVETYRVLDDGRAQRILFTGGLIQRFPPIQRLIEDELEVASRVFADEDAALTGLSSLSESL